MATEMATLLKTCTLKLVTQGACSKQLQEIFTKAAIHFSISRIQKTCTCQMIVTRSLLVARPEVGSATGAHCHCPMTSGRAGVAGQVGAKIARHTCKDCQLLTMTKGHSEECPAKDPNKADRKLQYKWHSVLSVLLTI